MTSLTKRLKRARRRARQLENKILARDIKKPLAQLPEPNFSGVRPSDLDGAPEWFKRGKMQQESTATLGGLPDAHPYSTGYSYSRKVCHHAGTSPVLDFGTTKIHAAAGYDLREEDSAALIIDCANATDDSVITLPAAYESLRQFAHASAPTIRLDWRDHGTPPVTFEFWEALYSALPEGKVIVCCTGGHGRTGTTLAALVIIAWELTAMDAIALVRKHHCVNCVETNGQREYLLNLAAWWRKKVHPNAPVIVEDAPIIVRDMSAMLDGSI